MKRFSALLMMFGALTFTACSDDDDGENGNGNGNGNGMSVGTFEASVSGDITEDINGIAYYETVSGDVAITLFVSFNNWPFITFLFNPPVEEGIYTAIGTATDQEDDETNASASNGNFLFFGNGGSVTITNVQSEQIDGEFTVNFQYSDGTEEVNIVIDGQFSAEKD
ncbi:MAG: hypothetical protein LAT54_02320 [Cryomorphaceae bacterium]|nr:hypothetical protein [Cryomorphaceae bacterium]